MEFVLFVKIKNFKVLKCHHSNQLLIFLFCSLITIFNIPANCNQTVLWLNHSHNHLRSSLSNPNKSGPGASQSKPHCTLDPICKRRDRHRHFYTYLPTYPPSRWRGYKERVVGVPSVPSPSSTVFHLIYVFCGTIARATPPPAMREL